MPYAPPPPPLNPAREQFAQLVDAALLERPQGVQQALDRGLCPLALTRYIAGAATPLERREVEGQLQHAPWALGRVIAVTKAARVEGPARELLCAARQGTLKEEGLVSRLEAI